MHSTIHVGLVHKQGLARPGTTEASSNGELGMREMTYLRNPHRTDFSQSYLTFVEGNVKADI